MHPDVLDSFPRKELLDQHATCLEVSTINVSTFNKLRRRYGIAFSDYLSLKTYLRTHSVDVVVHLYADHIANCLGIRPLSDVKVAGLFFRAAELTSDVYSGRAVGAFTSFKRMIRKSLFLRFIKAKTTLSTITMDSFLELPNNIELRFCPEPLLNQPVTGQQIMALKADLELSDDKVSILLFGGITPRKGFSKFLSSLRAANESTIESIQIVICGEVLDRIEGVRLKEEIRLLEMQGTPVRFIENHVPYSNVHLYVKVADIVAIPYIDHVGPSAILGRAILEEKFVLSTNYGLVGKTVCEYKRGCTFSYVNEQSFQDALSQALSNQGSNGHDPFRAQFVEENTVQNFVKVILESTES
jgi:glycosyltransferase involved in cell wall biosynthesis